MRFKLKQISSDVVLTIIGCIIGRMLVQYGKMQISPSISAEMCGEQLKRESAAKKHSLSISPVTDNAFMIGVMTTRKNLANRAAAIYSTWGAQTLGLLVFYIGQNNRNSSNRPQPQSDQKSDAQNPRQHSREVATAVKEEQIRVINQMPVVELRGVSDEDYPPRDKCFAMLRHMHSNFGQVFQWFVRADDDVYIRSERLVKFLHSLNDSKPWYIGQPGIGIPEERGRLGLAQGKPYCMGGPGVVFSAASLQVVVPHLHNCARDVVTSHEDTELGRCVWQHLNISCITERAMRNLFYHAYKKNDYPGPLLENLLSALTYHPVKDRGMMYSLYLSLVKQQLHTLQRREQQLLSDAKIFNAFAKESKRINPDISNNNITFNRQQQVDDFIKIKLGNQNPKLKPVQSWFFGQQDDEHGSRTKQQLSGLKENYTFRKEAIRREVLNYDNPLWSYAILAGSPFLINQWKVHNMLKELMNKAADFLSPFQTTLNKYVLKGTKFRWKYQAYTLTYGLQHRITYVHKKGYQSFLLSSKFGDLQWREVGQRRSDCKMTNDGHGKEEKRENKGQKGFLQKNKEGQKGLLQENEPSDQGYIGSHQNRGTMATTTWPSLWVLLPLSRRHRTYLRFLEHLTNAAKGYPSTVHLKVALYEDSLGEHRLSIKASKRNDQLDITVTQLKGQFSRAHALTTLAEEFNGTTVLIFIDVDLVVTEQFLRRVALNVQPGMVYFPTMFSKYSPETVCYGRRKCIQGLFDFSEDSGFWRSFSYGMVAIAAQDVRKVGGFNTEIIGWGKEDVDFFERCLKNKIQVFRAPDIGLVHEYHDKSCDPKLPADQLRMCNGSKLAIYGSISKLAKIVGELEHLLF